MSLYTEKRFGAAAASLAEAVRLGANQPSWPDSDQARFYLGLSLLLDGKPAPAREHHAQASDSTLRPVAERARWYLAQASLLLDDPQGALVLLQDLADRGLVYRDQAADQLAELQELMARSGAPEPEPLPR